MSAENAGPELPTKRQRVLQLWPWLVLALAVVPAVWHVVDFPDDLDREFPQVERPNFSPLPPPAYRLAEAGDTIDRVAIYVSALAIVFSVVGLVRTRTNRGLWAVGLVLSLAGYWHAATPGPTFDGWYGLGWRTIGDRSAPVAQRLGLATTAIVGACLVAGILIRERGRWAQFWRTAREHRVAPLLIVALVLVIMRQWDPPHVEPVGYWPRWAFVWALIAFDLALVRLLPPVEGDRRWLRGGMYTLSGVGIWFALTIVGIWVTWYHRPIDRFRAIVPGRIFISAMPTREGLDVVERRHHIKTIINLFPEDTRFRSPRLPEELRFAKQHGIRYVLNSSDPTKSNAFLDETLRIAQDPNAWPILVHCHGCMDRTPAWWGIYRFVVKGDPLFDIMRDIERHRGYRPKATVTLLYNRVLPPRAPERYRNDPTATLLRQSAHGARDPDEVVEAASGKSNPERR